MHIEEIAQRAKKASYALEQISKETKKRVLHAIRDVLIASKEEILLKNMQDRQEAKKLSYTFLDRLQLEKYYPSLIKTVEEVSTLDDRIGTFFDEKEQNGLHIKKCRVPLGVVGVIYESRPNVTIDIAALSIQSQNAVILRGGSECIRTNTCIVEKIQEALGACGISQDTVQLVTDTRREVVERMLQLDEYIDVIIPRGGTSLLQFCKEHSRIPILSGGSGICHLFSDASCNQEKALMVIENAKIDRPTVCNALDTLLVHAGIAEEFIPKVIKRLHSRNVLFRLDSEAYAIACKNGFMSCSREAIDSDWSTEWLDFILGIKVVEDVKSAVDHIMKHSTRHSDGILTEDTKNAAYFIQCVDASVVYLNASTRFTDGEALGLGGEVAVTTQKLHARGPVGIEGLTSYKWVVSGDYAIRK